MNKEVFEGRWDEMRGQIKGWWDKITDDDLDRIRGSADKLIGLIQEKYGYTHEVAEEEFNQRIHDAQVVFQRKWV